MDSWIHWFIGSLVHRSLIHRISDSVIHSFTGSLFHRLTHSLRHWCMDSSSHKFIRKLIHWFIDSPNRWVVGSLNHLFVDSLIHRPTKTFMRWIFDSLLLNRGFIASLIHWIIGSLIHWFVDSLVHLFIDSLGRWLVDSLGHCFAPSLVHLFIDSLVIIHLFIDSSVRLLVDSLGHCFAASVVHCFMNSLIHWFIRSELCRDSLTSLHWHLSHHFFIRWCTSQLQPLMLSASQQKTIGHWFPIVTYYFRNFRPGAPRALSGNLFWEYEPGEDKLKSLIFSVCFQPTMNESQPSWGFPLYFGWRGPPIAALFLVQNPLILEATLRWTRHGTKKNVGKSSKCSSSWFGTNSS